MKKTNPNVMMAKKHGARIVQYRDMPLEHQLAIAHYMAIDGEAWEVLGKLEEDFEKVQCKDYSNDKAFEKFRSDMVKLLRRSIHLYVEKYGKVKFGMAAIPARALMDATLDRVGELKRDHKSWKSYHDWYRDNCGIPKHSAKELWPVILSGFPDEVLEDGHHRFHSYVELGVKEIPCVFYP